MTVEELKAGTAAVRELVDDAGYGAWVTDAVCERIAATVIRAAETERQKSSVQVDRGASWNPFGKR